MQKLTDIGKANTAVCLNRLRVARQRLLGHKNLSVYTVSGLFDFISNFIFATHIKQYKKIGMELHIFSR